MMLLIVLLFFVCQAFSETVVPEPVGANLTLLVEHSLDKGKSFTTRTVAQLIPKGDGKIGLMFEDRNTVSGEEVQGLRSLIRSNDLYTIRITNPDSKAFVMASVPARSGFKEDIQVFLGKGGLLNGLSYSSPQMKIPQPCDASKVRDTVPFQTRIKMGEETSSPALPLQLQGPRPAFLKDVRLGMDEEKPANQQASQPFLYRYWYVVLGLVIYMMLGGSQGEPPKGAAAPAAAAAK